VGDNNNAILAYNPGRERAVFVHRFGSQGRSVGQFSGGVQGLRVKGDRIYTTDVGNCRLQIWDKSKLMQASRGTGPLVAAMGSCGTGANQMSVPRGLDVRRDGTVWVAETGFGRISIWDPRTRTSTSFRPRCEISQPWGLTFRNGWAYIGSVGNVRIVRVHVTTRECEVVNLVGTPGPALRGANYVEFDAKGRMYISDNSRRVLRYRLGD
jgi:sugar lactone lactonase YvrE